MSVEVVNDIPHLRQIGAVLAQSLCERALAVAPESYTARLEVKGFAGSRTPWDATRLANALMHLGRMTPEQMELITDLDKAAEDCAGCAPTNRLSRFRAESNG